MPPAKPTDDEPWLALRRKHDTELNDFQKQVQAAKVKFHANIEKGRAEILARHKKEEEGYWVKKHSTSKNSAANKPTASKASVKGQANGKATTQAKTPVPRPRQTPVPSSKASQTPKPTQARSPAAAPTSQTANKKAAVAYINLCSDDDDDDEPVVARKKPAPTKIPETQTPQAKPASSKAVDSTVGHDPPAYTIPSANLTLFGNTSKIFGGTPEPSGFKREHSVLSQTPLTSSTPPATSARNDNGGCIAPVPAPTFGQRASTATSSLPQATFGSYQHGFATQPPPNPFAQSASIDEGTSRHSTSSSPFARNVSSPFEQRSRESQLSTAQASAEIKNTAASSSTPGFSSWASPTASASQGPNLQRQTSVAPGSAPSPAPNNIAPPTGFASWNTQPRASTVAPQSPFLDRAWSSKQPVLFHGLPRGGDPTMQRQYSSPRPGLKVSGKQADSGSSFVPERPTPHTVSGSTHFGQQEQTSTAVPNGRVEQDGHDIRMSDAPRTPPHQSTNCLSPRTSQSHQHTPNMLPSPSHTSDSRSTPTPHQPLRGHRASPSPSVPEPLTPAPTSTSSFKRPSQPASATNILLNSRNVRAESQASSATLRASTIPRSERDSPVSPSPSSVTGGRKRKVAPVDISSEEESDYAPPSEDDEEPESPEDVEPSPKSKKGISKKSASGPPLKKARMPPPPPAVASNRVSSRGKNSFGFHVAPRSKPSPPTLTKPKNQPSTPTKLKQRQSAPIASPSRTSTRKAKLQAEEKISQLSEAAAQLWTEETIAEDDEREQPVRANGSMEDRLRSMSITPAPTVHGDEDVSTLVDTSEVPVTKASTKKKDSGWDTWTKSRVTGDRYLAKFQPRVEDGSDEEVEVDISKFRIVDGVIVDVNVDLLGKSGLTGVAQADRHDIGRDQRWRTRRTRK